jgi:hypothetical protein
MQRIRATSIPHQRGPIDGRQAFATGTDANLIKADLRSADLSGAFLRG